MSPHFTDNGGFPLANYKNFNVILACFLTATNPHVTTRTYPVQCDSNGKETEPERILALTEL